jgi:hypothetical protein
MALLANLLLNHALSFKLLVSMRRPPYAGASDIGMSNSKLFNFAFYCKS